jgi:hypothetical protein
LSINRLHTLFSFLIPHFSPSFQPVFLPIPSAASHFFTPFHLSLSRVESTPPSPQTNEIFKEKKTPSPLGFRVSFWWISPPLEIN